MAGSDFAFANDVGTLSPVFETSDDLYFFEVAQRMPAGVQPFEKVRSVVENAVRSERRVTIAQSRVSEAWAAVEAGRSMEEAAEELGLSYATTDTFNVRGNIPDVGLATPFHQVALALEEGQSATDVETVNGVYALRLLYKGPFDEEGFRAARSQLAQVLLYQRRQAILNEWMENLRRSATIVDRRAEFM